MDDVPLGADPGGFDDFIGRHPEHRPSI